MTSSSDVTKLESVGQSVRVSRILTTSGLAAALTYTTTYCTSVCTSGLVLLVLLIMNNRDQLTDYNSLYKLTEQE